MSIIIIIIIFNLFEPILLMVLRILLRLCVNSLFFICGHNINQRRSPPPQPKPKTIRLFVRVQCTNFTEQVIRFSCMHDSQSTRKYSFRALIRQIFKEKKKKNPKLNPQKMKKKRQTIRSVLRQCLWRLKFLVQQPRVLNSGAKPNVLPFLISHSAVAALCYRHRLTFCVPPIYR